MKENPLTTPMSNSTARKVLVSPAELFDKIRQFGPESAYVAAHVVRLDENVYDRFKVLYHYLARGTDFRVDGDTSTVIIDDRRRQWSALDNVDMVHGTDPASPVAEDDVEDDDVPALEMEINAT